MFTRTLPLAILALFFIAFLVAANLRPDELAKYEIALTWSLRFAGGIVSLLGAAETLARAWRGDGLVPCASAVAAVLAGGVLYAPQWSMVVALGLVGAVFGASAWIRSSGQPGSNA